MKLFTILSSLTIALLTLGTPSVSHTVEEAYYDVELLQETCLTARDKFCSITPEHAEGGGLKILRRLKELNEVLDIVQARPQKTKPFPPGVQKDIEAGLKIFKDCLVEIVLTDIPRLLDIPEIKDDSYEFLAEYDTLIHQETICLIAGVLIEVGYLLGVVE